jgi:hypothetical protein
MNKQFEKALAKHYDAAFEKFRRQEVQSLPKKAKLDILTRLTLQRLVDVFSEPSAKKED